MYFNSSLTFEQVDNAIAELISGERVVSVSVQNPDGSTEKVEYSSANIRDLMIIRDRLEPPRPMFTDIEVEVY